MGCAANLRPWSSSLEALGRGRTGCDKEGHQERMWWCLELFFCCVQASSRSDDARKVKLSITMLRALSCYHFTKQTQGFPADFTVGKFPIPSKEALYQHEICRHLRISPSALTSGRKASNGALRVELIGRRAFGRQQSSKSPCG